MLGVHSVTCCVLELSCVLNAGSCVLNVGSVFSMLVEVCAQC